MSKVPLSKLLWSLTLLWGLLSTLVTGLSVKAQPHVKIVEGRDAHLARLLTAVRGYSVKRTRDTNTAFALKSTLSLDYADKDSLAGSEPFGASLLMEAKHPALVLEDIEQFLALVQCSQSGILLKFHSREQSMAAEKAWNITDFLVFTSHQGCNKDGERQPYLVSNVSFDHSRAMVTLTARPVAWKDSFTTLEVSFGIQKPIKKPSSERSVSTLSKRASKDISFSLINRDLIRLTAPGTVITSKCVTCTGTGTFTIRSGGFKMHNSGGLFGGIIDGFKDIAHIAEFAFVDIVANNLRANFDIETTIQLQKVFTFHLLGGPQSLAGFSIAGVFSIGPAIDPTLVLSIKNTQPLTFDMGFDMAVPDGASLNIDIVNVARSSASGFDATKFNGHPFQISTKIGLNVTAAFRPIIEFGISVFNFDFEPVQVFADVPRYEGSLLLASGLDDNCNPSVASTTEHLSYRSDFTFDIGVGAKIDLTDKIAFAPQHVIASTRVFPSSTCFALGPKESSTQVASSTVAVVNTPAGPGPVAPATTAAPSVGPITSVLPTGGLLTTTVVLSSLNTQTLIVTKTSGSSVVIHTTATATAVPFTRTMTYCATCVVMPTATGTGNAPWMNGSSQESAPAVAALPKLRRRVGRVRLA